jgi:predicted DCC family thiol-disulfide oxidoreductase YuxK
VTEHRLDGEDLVAEPPLRRVDERDVAAAAADEDGSPEWGCRGDLDRPWIGLERANELVLDEGATLRARGKVCSMPSADHVLLFDADCGFCRWSVRQVLAWDRRGRVLATTIQGEEGERLLAGMAPERRLDSWHLVTPAGRVLSAGAAAPELALVLPGGRPLAYLFRTFPSATERAYRWVASHRGLLARLLRIDLERERRGG